MLNSRDRWSMFHFSQSNPKDHGSADVPALLRRVADSIDEHGDVKIQDLVLHFDLEDGDWRPSITVYYSRNDDN